MRLVYTIVLGSDAVTINGHDVSEEAPDTPIVPPDTPTDPTDTPPADTRELLYDAPLVKSNMLEMLKDGPYWVFLDGIHPTDIESPLIQKYVEPLFGKDGKGMRFTLSKDAADFMGGSLNPRFELSLNRYYSPFRTYSVEIVCAPVGPSSATFMQIAGRNLKNEGKPIVVLDTFEGKTNVRYRDIDRELSEGREWMVRSPLMDSDQMHDVLFRVDVRVSDAEDGFIRVFADGVVVFERLHKRTYWPSSRADIKFSFGIYQTKHIGQQSMDFKKFSIYRHR